MSDPQSDSQQMLMQDASQQTPNVGGYQQLHPAQGAGLTPEALREGRKSGADYHAWCGDIEDEAALRRAVEVMSLVLNDIADWEDKELAEAVEAAKVELQTMADRIALMSDRSSQ